MSRRIVGAGGETMSVLVVDDEPSITEMIDLQLREQFDVRPAHGVRAALARIAESEPTVLLTDLGMDDGGGEYLLAAVASAHPDVLRIVHSAASFCVLTWILDSGLADAVIPKGADTFQIRALLSALVSSRAMELSGFTAQ